MAQRARIPEHVREVLRARLERHARASWDERCREVVVRFRGPYAYVDAFTSGGWYPPGATPEERARIDSVPVHLCRLGYLGSPERWAFSFFKYSNEVYEPSILPSGSFAGTPEEAFDCCAELYLLV